MNLQRSNITEKYYSFEYDLLKEIIDDFFAYLIVNCPTTIDQLPPNGMRLPANLSYKYGNNTLETPSEYQSQLILPNTNLSSEGITLHGVRKPNGNPVTLVNFLFSLKSHHLELASSLTNKIICPITEYRKYAGFTENESASSLYLFTMLSLLLSKKVSLSPYGSTKSLEFIVGAPIIGSRVLVPLHEIDKVKSNAKWLDFIDPSQRITEKNNRWQRKLTTEEIIEELCEKIEIETILGNYALLKMGDCLPTAFNINTLATLPSEELYFLEVFTNKPAEKSKYPRRKRLTNDIMQRWHEVIHHPVIPFDIDERKTKLAHAYEELDYFIKCHEAMKAKGIKP